MSGKTLAVAKRVYRLVAAGRNEEARTQLAGCGEATPAVAQLLINGGHASFTSAFQSASATCLQPATIVIIGLVLPIIACCRFPAPATLDKITSRGFYYVVIAWLLYCIEATILIAVILARHKWEEIRFGADPPVYRARVIGIEALIHSAGDGFDHLGKLLEASSFTSNETEQIRPELDMAIARLLSLSTPEQLEDLDAAARRAMRVWMDSKTND